MLNPRNVRKGNGTVVTYSEEFGYDAPVIREAYFTTSDAQLARELWDTEMFTYQFNDPDAALKADILAVEPLIEWQARQ